MAAWNVGNRQKKKSTQEKTNQAFRDAEKYMVPFSMETKWQGEQAPDKKKEQGKVLDLMVADIIKCNSGKEKQGK